MINDLSFMQPVRQISRAASGLATMPPMRPSKSNTLDMQIGREMIEFVAAQPIDDASAIGTFADHPMSGPSTTSSHRAMQWPRLEAKLHINTND